MWYVTKYKTVNLDIISETSHPTQCTFVWSIQVGTFPALPPDRANRSSFMTLNAYSQHDLVSVSDGVQWRYTAQAVTVI